MKNQFTLLRMFSVMYIQCLLSMIAKYLIFLLNYILYYQNLLLKLRSFNELIKFFSACLIKFLNLIKFIAIMLVQRTIIFTALILVLSLTAWKFIFHKSLCQHEYNAQSPFLLTYFSSLTNIFWMPVWAYFNFTCKINEPLFGFLHK